MNKPLIRLINFYQKYISCYKLPTCKYYPSCSQYAKDAIEKHGVAFGVYKAFLRLLRCNPFSRGGYDPA